MIKEVNRVAVVVTIECETKFLISKNRLVFEADYVKKRVKIGASRKIIYKTE